jgi:hypothetical protein
LERALKLDLGNPWIYYDRAVYACNRQDWGDALTDFRKGLARMPFDPWPFWMGVWLCRTRLGEADGAREELATCAGEVASSNPDRLTSKIARLALGQLSVRTFLEELARVPRTRGEAARGYFYAAERALADGDPASAADLLGRCAKARAVTSAEDSIAAAELRVLSEKRR